MTNLWLIVADDLTGAADCGVAFAKRGLSTMVGWGEMPGGAAGHMDVLCFNTESRGYSATEAEARVMNTLDRFGGCQRRVLKKIDSTLRGEPAAEIAATVKFFRERLGSAFAIFAPAFPAQGRTTLEGRMFLHGRPLEESELWRREHRYGSAELLAVLATAGLTGERVPLESIRGSAEGLRDALLRIASRGYVAVCDATTQRDLDRLAAGSPAIAGAFYVGSAGLGHALAGAMANASAAPMPLVSKPGAALVVVGSLASRQAAAALAGREGVGYVAVMADFLRDGSPVDQLMAIGKQVLEGLDAGIDMLVEIVGRDKWVGAIESRLVRNLAGILRSVGGQMSGLVLTGGETAAAFLEAYGVMGIQLVDEIEPGVALGLTLGGVSLPVVTKAGAFGDEGSLIRIVERLRRMRRSGSWA